MTRLVVQYFLNDRLDPALVARQLEQFAAAGYDGVYPHARAGLTTPYFSADWWAVMDTIAEHCRRLGLKFWIWDEDYYPSGQMGGRIVWEDPGLAARGLEFTVARCEGAGPFEVDFAPGALLRCFAVPERADGQLGEPVDITAWCGTRRQHWGPRQVLHRAYSPLVNDVGHPHWRSWMSENRFAVVWTPPQPGTWQIVATLHRAVSQEAPDFLRPESIARFLELSHDAYHARYGAEFGELIEAIFTDEPNPAGQTFPWTPRFAEEFRADHRYDLLDRLPHLALDIDERSATIRHHYRLTQHRLLRSHYVDQIAAWCEAHGVLMSGHLTRTEWLSLVAAWWPNELRCYRAMHIPAADPLGASVAWPDAAAYTTGLKVASSAAHLFGRDQAGTDALAIIGDEAGLRDLKYQLDFQMVLGINQFTLHGASYSFRGHRKDEVPPSLFCQHTEFPHFPVLWDHVRGTCAELTGGRHQCEVAVLYPATSLYCQITPHTGLPNLPDEALIHQVSEQLLSAHCDFDFIDEVTLDESVDEFGTFLTSEPYRIVILPHLRFVDAACAAALLRLVRGGGRVIAVGGLPLALPREPAAAHEWADERVEQVADLAEVLDSLPRLPVSGDGASDVFVLERRVDGAAKWFCFNRAEREFSGTVAGRPVVIAGRGSALLKADDAPAVAAPGPVVADLSADWTVTFGANQLPLNAWHVEHPAGAEPPYGGRFALPLLDLLRREPDPTAQSAAPARYWCRFMLDGEVPDARLAIEPGFCGEVAWRLLVNDQPICAWREDAVFDNYTQVADLGPLLRTGSTPTLNTICLEAAGPGRNLAELPYLLGSFRAEYRYGHPSFPFLCAAPATLALPTLLPWDTLGYPTYSGAVRYERQFSLAEPAEVALDLGRVEDLAEVALDGQPPRALAWPPYRCALGRLGSGPHDLAITVWNPPANRNRAARLPAGLLGPVRLRRSGRLL